MTGVQYKELFEFAVELAPRIRVCSLMPSILFAAAMSGGTDFSRCTPPLRSRNKR